MISRSWAIEVVERQLKADWEAEPAARRKSLGQPLVIIDIEQHALGWAVTFNSKRYAETQDFRHSLIGQGFFLVDGVDGSLHEVHRQFCNEMSWEEQYRQKVRHEVPPPAFETEVQRLVGLGRRSDAIKVVRSTVGGLPLGEAARVVDAIGAGREIPHDLVARFPRPGRSYPAIVSHGGPNPEPDEKGRHD